MERLQRAKGSRKAYRSHLTRIYRKMDDILEVDAPKTDLQVSTLTSVLEQLNQKKTQISQLDAQIAESIETSEELETEILQTEEVQSELLDRITRLRQFFEQRSRTSTAPLDVHAAEFTSSSPATSTETLTRMLPTPPAARREPVSRLPKLSLPNFSGNPLAWQSFRDSFDAAVHNNPSLDGIQKFNYLRAQLEGDAARVIAGLPLTSANYDNAMTLLTERFGQPHKIINAHMQALLDVANPVNSLSSLQLFYDTIEGHIRGLAALGKSEDLYGALLIPIILGKLPMDIQRNLAREHGSLEWTLRDLKQGILREIRVLESGLSINPTTRLSFDQQPRMTTTSLHTGASNNTTANTQSLSSKRPCVFCKSTAHLPTKCDTIMEPQKRLAFIKGENLCFNCFGHHKVSHCHSKFRCKICKKKHHTSLCDNATKPNTDQTKGSNTGNTPPKTDTATAMIIPVSPQPESISTSHSPVSSSGTGCLLKTAVAEVRAGTYLCKANILFDEGAQKSFISQQLADNLHVQPFEHQNIRLSSFGGTDTPTNLQAARIHLQTTAGDEIPISVLIVPKIATPLKNLVPTPVKCFPYLQGLTLAHPIMQNSDFEISLLIGADFYWDVVQDHIIRGNGPTAMESKLGYLLSGPVPSQTIDNTFQMFNTLVQPLEESNIAKFWDIESLGTLSATDSSSDNQFLTSYLKSSVTCQPNGSYIVKFPWKDKHPPLPSNRHICEKRARSLAYKLSHTPHLFQLYGEIISEQLKRGFIEEVAESKIPSHCHFIPHHPVHKDSTTTPIRIVYDCSCHQSANYPSLNDCLQVGPPFINDLCTLLLRFRVHKIGVVTDIEKAFLHVQLAEEDRNYTHFLWLSKPNDPASEFTVYRFKVVLFGSVSSPFMLNAVLQHLLRADGSTVAKDIRQNLYVDNVISGFSNEERAVQYYKQARKIMSNANFNLRSWASNSTNLRKVAQKDNVADERSIVNVLGLLWDTSTDTLSLNPKELTSTQHSLVTKRAVLKDLSKIFDPLGLIAPVTIMAKLFMQELWHRQLDWDKLLPEDMMTRWYNLKDDIQLTFGYQVSRVYQNPEIPPKEIHVFMDASKKAYGAVAYICQGEKPSLIMSKTRVAPIKALSLPRLELMAAVVGTRLYKFIIASLPQHYSCIPVFMWSDSQIVLYWILNQRKLKPFVASRIQEINNSVAASSWRYCPTQHNPADLVTRGISYKTFAQCTLWEHGPLWLSNHAQWPEWNKTVTLSLQVDTNEFTELTESPEKPPLEIPGLHQIINIIDHSSLTKLLHISAYVLRFIMNSKQADISDRRLGPLLPEEIRKVLLNWIHSCQQTTFANEFVNLQSSNLRTRRLPLVRQLRLFLDNKGTIRCGGRIHNAPLDDRTKFPALLPKEHPLTRLIVYSVHKEQLHTGVNGTVAALRQEYWIPSARQLVRRLLRQCVSCRKVIGKPYSIPDPPPLPHSRTKEGKPFEITGVDFTGALYVRNPQGEGKVYICLFTCGLTRAVHLEVVSNLNVETFLQAFRRFVSRKSLPQLMLSDNASTYVAAAKELEQLFSSQELGEALSSRGIKWQFISKRAPWYGGFWERLIGMTKTTIKKVLGRSFISLEALQTLVVEIEAILNDRPLTYLSADVEDPEPLTPSHLLYGRRITTLPYLENDLTDPTYSTSSTLREKSRRQTQLLQHFQSRWKKEYLTSLREAHRMTGTNLQSVKVGDIVLIHDDTPRMQWRLAMIEEVIRGLDGLVRAAKIRTSSGKTNRPLAKNHLRSMHQKGKELKEHLVPLEWTITLMMKLITPLRVMKELQEMQLQGHVR